MIMLKEKQTNLKRKQSYQDQCQTPQKRNWNKQIQKREIFFQWQDIVSFLVFSLAISKECLLLTKINVAKWGTPLKYFYKKFVFMNSFEIFLWHENRWQAVK
jgi:hypothetical protein